VLILVLPGSMETQLGYGEVKHFISFCRVFISVSKCTKIVESKQETRVTVDNKVSFFIETRCISKTVIDTVMESIEIE